MLSSAGLKSVTSILPAGPTIAHRTMLLLQCGPIANGITDNFSVITLILYRMTPYFSRYFHMAAAVERLLAAIPSWIGALLRAVKAAE
jgi:high-affinity K+ transport system ATPase subunit B